MYISLSEKCGDEYGICQGYFAISEIYKRSADWSASILALQKCWNLAKENGFDIPLAFSAISLGQVETAKVSYNYCNNFLAWHARKKILIEQDVVFVFTTHWSGSLGYCGHPYKKLTN